MDNKQFNQENSVSYFEGLIDNDPHSDAACYRAKDFVAKYGDHDPRYQIHLENCQICRQKNIDNVEPKEGF